MAEVELFKKNRPKTFKSVYGQTEAIGMLQGFLKKDKLPHQLLYTGESGTGKTTLCRIVGSKLGCEGNDYIEYNCADFRGIDMVREIRVNMKRRALGGSGRRLYAIDESHQLTTDAQNAFLKILEEPPDHIYFALLTTHPKKLAKAIITRCTEIRCNPLTEEAMKATLKDFIAKEEGDVSKKVLDRIVTVSQGSARRAIVILNQVLMLDSEEQQLKVIVTAEADVQSIQLCRALLEPKTNWKTMQGILSKLTDDPETLRLGILGYASGTLMRVQSPRAYFILLAFEEPYYNSGKAGLVRSCYEVINRPK